MLGYNLTRIGAQYPLSLQSALVILVPCRHMQVIFRIQPMTLYLSFLPDVFHVCSLIN